MLLETSDDARTTVDGAEGQIAAELSSSPPIEQCLEHLDLWAKGLLTVHCMQDAGDVISGPEFH
ncbi:MAG: hypothetical protein ACYDGN_17005 [Acidimicrobiales bacterium]